MSPTENTGDIPPRPPLASLDLHHELTAAIKGMSEPEKRNILELIENSLKNEKRKRLRRRHHIKAEVSNGSKSGNGIIKNIGPDGAFLATGQLHAPGSEITLRFSILNFEFPLILKAEVIWTSPKGMGLRFKSSQKLDYRLAAQKLADAMGPMPRDS